MNFEFYKLNTVYTKKFWFVSSSCHRFYLLPFFLFLLLTDPDYTNFKNKWKFVKPVFFGTLGRNGGYRGTPIKEKTLYFSWIYTLSEFCGILGLPIEVALQYKTWGVVGFVAPGCGYFDSSPVFIVGWVSQLVERKKPTSYCMFTNLSGLSFYVSFLVSSKIFLVCF